MKAISGVHSAAGLRVRFVEDGSGNLTAVEMELPREQENLGDVHTELRALGIVVTNVEVRANAERVVERIHLRELNGDPLSRERHREIQDRVLGVFQVRMIRPCSRPIEALPAAAG